jgi:predicted O-methyltransferase YrrM
MTAQMRRRLLLLGPAVLGAVGAGSLLDALHVDGWAITLAALLGGVLAGAQAWLLLGQRADRRAASAELRESIAALGRVIETTLASKRDLENFERRLRQGTAEDEAQMEAYTQLTQLLPPRTPLPRTRGWAASPDFLLTVVDIVLQRRPGLVVDVGSGLTTVWEALACESIGFGRVVAIDHDEQFGRATDHLVGRQGLAGRAEVRFAPLTEQRAADRDVLWYDAKALHGLDLIDVVVVDGPPGTTGPLARFPALPLLWDRLSPDAVIVLDDADRDDERATVEEWLALYPELTVERLRHEKGAVILRRGHRRS